MANATVPCPHCKAAITVPVGEIGRCGACGGEVRVHEVAADVDDEMLKRLLSSVKIVERVDGPTKTADASSAPSDQESAADEEQRPRWVKIALWGVPGRAAAWLFMWLSIAIAVGCIAYGFVNARFFLGGSLLLAAVGYYLAIRWVDEYGSWPPES